MDNPIKFKAKLTILLAIFGLQEFVLNANNKIEMSIDQAHALNDELQSKDNEINNLKAEKAEFENTMKAKNDKIAELQAIVDQIPGGPPANPKGGDNITGGDDDPVEDLDDDTSKKLREYNKTSGISLV